MTGEIQQMWHCNRCNEVTKHEAVTGKTLKVLGKIYRERKCVTCTCTESVNTVEMREDEFRDLERKLAAVRHLLGFAITHKAKGILEDIAKGFELSD